MKPTVSTLAQVTASVVASFWFGEQALSVTAVAVPRCQAPSTPDFLVFAGGGAPHYNEIALEKNVLYFQRTLNAMGYDPKQAAIYFANGNDGRNSIRYFDPQGEIQFKAPQIPNLKGAATLPNLRSWFNQAKTQPANKPLFFYFTGHGFKDSRNVDNNAMILWNEQLVSVKQWTRMLDQLPTEKTVVTMMAQCYSGAFANFIYEGGDPKRPVAAQNRCGFFATIKTRPSVGCTPAVNEADYRDYSSSFFAGLSGRSRVGEKVTSADYDRDGRVSYLEAHAFAKVDEHTSDLPISTSESWLQNQLSSQQKRKILDRPISEIVTTARLDQRYVVDNLMQRLKLNPQKSFNQQYKALERQLKSEEEEAYLIRFGTELVTIAAEKQLRERNNPQEINTLEQLLQCERGSWAQPEQKS